MLNISKLKRNDSVKGKFLIAEKNVNRTKDGKAFLRLSLMNKTGRIEGTLWDHADAAAVEFNKGQIVLVQGWVTTFQNELKINVKAMSPVREKDIERSDFLPSSSRSPTEMSDELHRTIRGMKNPFLRHLMEALFRDADIWERFSRVPAAKSIHHAYIGGLLEHSLSVARLVRLVVKNYPFLDMDLMTAAALTHDMGKAWEISPEFGFDYTDEGKLIGHIHIGLRVLEEKIADIPEFPTTLAMHLKHIIGSHHGEPEFGALKQPMTLEAVCLHQVDNLDAKLHGIREHIEKETLENEEWSAYHRVHQRYFFVPESGRHLSTSEETSKPEPGNNTPPDLFDL